MFGVGFSAIGGKCDRRGLVAATSEKGVSPRARHPQGYCGAWDSLPHIGIECSEEDTATLKFLTDRKLPRGAVLGFVVTDVNDKSFLIGSLETPRPIIECEQRTGIPSGDAAGYDKTDKSVLGGSRSVLFL